MTEVYWIIAKNMPRLGLHRNLLKVGLSDKAVVGCPFLAIHGYGPRDRLMGCSLDLSLSSGVVDLAC